VQKDDLYSFLFFEHHNRILLSDLSAHTLQCLFDWGCACHNAFILYLASTSLGISILLCSSVVPSRGASRGSTWLSWQAPLYCRYSALKLIKYQMLSLQVSNAGGLEQATIYISLLTLHSTITKQQHLCLV